MAGIMVSRTRLFKEVLFSTLRVNGVSQPRSSIAVPFPAKAKKFSQIPGPNLLKYYLGMYPFENLPSIYEIYFAKYGPIFQERRFRGPNVVHVFDPLDMQKIYYLDKFHPPCRMSRKALEEYRIKNQYRNGGLATADGNEWAELRESLGQDLLKKHHSEAFEIVARSLVNEILSLIAYHPNNEVDLFPLLYHWAIECVAAWALGESFYVFENKDTHPFVNKFIRSIQDTQEALYYTENLPGIFTKKWRKKLEDSQDLMYYLLMRPMGYPVHQLYKYEWEPIPESITVEGATICLKNSLAHALVENEVDDRDVRTFIVDIFLGGIHPPAHVLALALFHLANNPAEMKKVRLVLADKFKNLDDEYSSVPICKEINNVILETMRLHPSTFGTSRVLQEPLILSDYLIPKGTMCFLHHQIASRFPEVFANPEKFVPDRFNEPLSKAATVASSPFSRGVRACPAEEVAMNELGLALTAILRRFDVSCDQKEVSIKRGLINVPDNKMRISFKPSNE